jgi:hypothetical protein
LGSNSESQEGLGQALQNDRLSDLLTSYFEGRIADEQSSYGPKGDFFERAASLMNKESRIKLLIEIRDELRSLHENVKSKLT